VHDIYRIEAGEFDEKGRLPQWKYPQLGRLKAA
jgi:hypothetical protein